MASGAGWLLALCAACCLAVRGGCSDVEVPWNEEFALQHDIKYIRIIIMQPLIILVACIIAYMIYCAKTTLGIIIIYCKPKLKF